MTRSLATLLLCLCSLFIITAPVKGNMYKKTFISGKITNENKEPVGYATIAVYKTDASNLVTGNITNENGEFSISVPPGNYYLKINFLSYLEETITNIAVGSDGADIGTVRLKPSVTQIEEVKVQAERSQMEIKLDKRVFVVGKDLANAGNSAADVLDNVPSVSVDVDGNVSLRGSQGVQILIDGKPSGASGGQRGRCIKAATGQHDRKC
ncbi:MAG: TonB-dependent receptor [Bacteroidales bacterium]|nr:TonB-dependent receptor [Bacteroidales bacterium]